MKLADELRDKVLSGSMMVPFDSIHFEVVEQNKVRISLHSAHGELAYFEGMVFDMDNTIVLEGLKGSIEVTVQDAL